MESSSTAADRIIQFLVANAQCAECGSDYHIEDVHVLGQLELRIWDLAAVCHSCYTLSVVRAVVRSVDGTVETEVEVPEGVCESGAPTAVSWSELTTAEERHFEGLAPVGVDDVLDIHQFLRAFDGDFRGYFSQEPDGV